MLLSIIVHILFFIKNYAHFIFRVGNDCFLSNSTPFESKFKTQYDELKDSTICLILMKAASIVHFKVNFIDGTGKFLLSTKTRSLSANR